MPSEQKGPVVGADGQVLEPADTWLKCLDPQYRDRTIRIVRDDKDLEVLLFDNEPLELIRAQLVAA